MKYVHKAPSFFQRWRQIICDWWLCNIWFYINHTSLLSSVTRVRHRFLLWPKSLDGETRWLECSWWREYRFYTWRGHYRWKAEKWSDCLGN